jgi:hypothetical protein
LPSTGTQFLEERALRVDEALGDAPLDPKGREPEERSVPLVAVDYVAARVAASANGTSPADRRQVGALSDSIWRRYRELDLSPAVVAYWAEVCAALPSWPRNGWSGVATDTYGFLSSFHGPCSDVGYDGPIIDGDRGTTCVVLSPRDSVSLAGQSDEYLRARASTVVTSDVARHDSLDGLVPCLESVLPKR